MCTGSSPVVRSPIAAAAARGSMFSVRGSMSQNTGRAFSNSTQLAEATNENGEVTTSSPGWMPAARTARCRPPVPLETPDTGRPPRRAESACSKAGSRGPSERRRERSVSRTRVSSAGPMLGRASGVTVERRAGSRPGRRCRACRSAGGPRPLMLPAPGQHAGLERVDEGLPARLDDVLGDADRAPGVGPVAGVEQHARDRPRALALVEDAHLEVHELDVAQVRVALANGVAQSLVQRVHRPVPLGGADVALAVDPDLDRGLGLDPAVGALLHDRAPRLEPEQRLVLARLLSDQEIEPAVGGLELIALVLELLDPVHHAG